MTAYYVLAATFVLFALVLFAFGMLREDFPPSRSEGRVLMAVAGLIAIVTFGVLLSTTHREHPREEAAEAAEEKAAEGGEAKQGEAPEGAAGVIPVVENEYSIELENGDTLRPGKVELEVDNQGKVPHDLAIEGNAEAKTPLIDPGKKAKLEADLRPGEYKFYCTVPGHEELGMRTEVKVGG